MKVFAKPGRRAHRQSALRHDEALGLEEVERARLLAIFEACAAAELALTLAIDHAARRGLDARVLVRGAELCGRTARAVAGMERPDPARVHDELAACRRACVDAAAVCDVARTDAIAHRASLECRRCERACLAILHRLEHLAA